MALIADTLTRYAKTVLKTFAHERSETVGASEIGLCARKTFYVKNAIDPQMVTERDPEHVDTWGTRLRGTLFEDKFWLPAMRKRFGKRLVLAGKQQTSFRYEFLSATPDGVVVDLTDEELAELGLLGGADDIAREDGRKRPNCVAVECKTIDPRTTLIEAKASNIFQCHVQMGLLRMNPKYQPSHAVLSYTDASDWSVVTEFVIKYDERIFEAAIIRARNIMTAQAGHELEPEGFLRGGKECRYCPYTKACGIDRRRLPFQEAGPVDPQFKAEITDMALSYRAYEQATATTIEQMNRVKERIKERLREKGVRKIPGVITWSEVKGRETYDNKAVQAAAIAAGIDLEQFKEYGDPTDRLLIAIGKQQNEDR
jgi:hypothetical protein